MFEYPKEVNIHEVSPRDGFQSLKEFIPTEDKVRIINNLIDANFKQIEVTSFVHPKAIPNLSDAGDVLKRIKRPDGVKFRALVPNLRGLERAIDAGVHKVKLMLSGSESHSLSNSNASINEVMNGFEPLVKRAEESKIYVSGSISVAFGCPYEGAVPIENLARISERYMQLGINEISLADTTGMGNPALVKKVIRELKHRFPMMKFSLHLHNTRGMAFANAVAGLEEGIVDFDSATGGLGGCPYAPNASGNIATEDLIHGFEEMGIKTGVNLDKVIQIGRNFEEMFPSEVNSFILKAGKCSELSIAPTKQIKIDDK